MTSGLDLPAFEADSVELCYREATPGNLRRGSFRCGVLPTRPASSGV